MADNKVKFLRGTSAEYEASTKDNDVFYYITDTQKLYLGANEVTGEGITVDDGISFDVPETRENLVSGETIGSHFGKIAKHMEDESIHHTVDDALSDTSENPVENKAVKAAFDKKADKNYKIDSSDAFTTDRTIVGIKDELETVVYREYIKYGTSGETNKYWRIYNGSGLYSDIRGTVEGTTAVWNFSKSNGITDININVDGKNFYHEGYKPYVIITTSIPANATTVTTNHGFQPSIVFYRTGFDVKVAKSATTTTITIDETSTTARSITYVIFR